MDRPQIFAIGIVIGVLSIYIIRKHKKKQTAVKNKASTAQCEFTVGDKFTMGNNFTVGDNLIAG